MVAKRRLPVFGIGTGMQLLNVSQGGNLLLHIPEDMPKALPHKDPIDPAPPRIGSRFQLVDGACLW